MTKIFSFSNPSLIYLPVTTGLILTLSFPPFHFIFPPFIGLVPLLVFIHEVRCRREVIYGSLIAGLMFFGTLVYWIALLYNFSPLSIPGYIVTILLQSFYICLFSLTVWLLKNSIGNKYILFVPFVWIASENLRAQGDLAFTWGQLGYSLTNYPFLIQFADVLGSYGVGFWIVAVNCLLFMGWMNKSNQKTRNVYILAAMMLFLLPNLYNYHRWSSSKSSDKIRVSVIQPNIPQEKKWEANNRDQIFNVNKELSQIAINRKSDLIVWPETAVPAFVRHNMKYRSEIERLARISETPFLVGSQDYIRREEDYDLFNSAFLFDNNGELQEQYNKIFLVPMTEKIPFNETLFFMRKISDWIGSFKPGSEYTIFSIPQGRFAVLICYESIFPELSRRFRLNGANFLVNMTNDAWFGKTSAPYQHASHLVLRAIENRVAVARSANTGISEFVDPFGRVYSSTKIFTKDIKTEDVAITNELTFYTLHGDLIVMISWIVTIGGIFLMIAKKVATRRF